MTCPGHGSSLGAGAACTSASQSSSTSALAVVVVVLSSGVSKEKTVEMYDLKVDYRKTIIMTLSHTWRSHSLLQEAAVERTLDIIALLRWVLGHSVPNLVHMAHDQSCLHFATIHGQMEQLERSGRVLPYAFPHFYSCPKFRAAPELIAASVLGSAAELPASSARWNSSRALLQSAATPSPSKYILPKGESCPCLAGVNRKLEQLARPGFVHADFVTVPTPHAHVEGSDSSRHVAAVNHRPSQLARPPLLKPQAP